MITLTTADEQSRRFAWATLISAGQHLEKDNREAWMLLNYLALVVKYGKLEMDTFEW